MTPTVEELVAAVRQAGADLELDDEGRLVLVGTVDDVELLAELRERRTELVEHLEGPGSPEPARMVLTDAPASDEPSEPPGRVCDVCRARYVGTPEEHRRGIDLTSRRERAAQAQAEAVASLARPTGTGWLAIRW